MPRGNASSFRPLSRLTRWPACPTLKYQVELRPRERAEILSTLQFGHLEGFTTFLHWQYIISGRSGLNHGWVADDVCWRALGEGFSFDLLTQQCYEVLAGRAPSS
jgi:hypothetical protein